MALTGVTLLAFTSACGEEQYLDNYDAPAYQDDENADRLPEPAEPLGDGEMLTVEDPNAPMEELTAGVCVQCSPWYQGACGFGTLTWQQSCNISGCAAILSYGGGCGLCYCGQVCQQTQNTGNISASPTTVPIDSGTGCTNIAWDVDCGDSQIWVSHNGAAETLFAQGSSGNQAACWIQLDNTYTFSLYEGLDKATVLDSVQVTGAQAPNVCDNCAAGTSCHCFDNVCRPYTQQCP